LQSKGLKSTGEGKNGRLMKPMTKPELEVAMILAEAGIKYVREWKVLGKYYDFKIKNTNILLEIDGTYFHHKDGKISMRSVKQKTEDLYKDCLAVMQGYQLIRVWEDEIDKTKLLNKIELLKTAFADNHSIVRPYL